MTDFPNFQPQQAQDILDAIEDEVGHRLTDDWNRAKARISANLTYLAQSALRVSKLLADGAITEADADAIVSQQENLLNVTLNTVALVPYQAAQSILNGIFKVVGWVIFNRTGINLFPALVP